MGFSKRALFFCTIPLLLSSAVSASAQTSAQERWFVPTASLGVSRLFADLEDPGASVGIVMRGGLRLPIGDVTALVEHWNRVGDLRISVIQLETRYQILPQRRVTPMLLIGMGYSWIRLRDEIREQSDLDDAENNNGISASYGLGLHGALSRSLALQPEVLLRTDGGGFSGGLRLLASWSPSSRQLQNGRSGMRLGVSAYWLAPLSGPWRFVEPGYAVRIERSLSDDLSSSLAFAVFHWQIPGDAFQRDFIWDTRAVVAMPGVAWDAADGRPITLRGGPSIVMMGEGPGDGANIGAHIEAAASSPWDIPISGGIGWFWMPNDGGGDADIGTDDQHGVTVFAGVRF